MRLRVAVAAALRLPRTACRLRLRLGARLGDAALEREGVPAGVRLRARAESDGSGDAEPRRGHASEARRSRAATSAQPDEGAVSGSVKTARMRGRRGGA